MAKTELDWRAEEDAETLARYNEIMSDTKRKNKAIKVALQRANELQKRADNMKKVGKKGRK